MSFTYYFNYAEGLEIGSDIVLAGIDVGKVTDLKLKDSGVLLNGSINDEYAIPSDSLLTIRSNGIFGKKSLLIEPGYGDIIQRKTRVLHEDIGCRVCRQKQTCIT